MHALRLALCSLTLLAACSRQEDSGSSLASSDPYYPSQSSISGVVFAFDNPGRNADLDYDDVRVGVAREGLKGAGKLAQDASGRIYAEGGDVEGEFLVTEEFGSCSAEIQMYTLAPGEAGYGTMQARGLSKDLKDKKGSLTVKIPAGHALVAWVFVKNGVNPVMNCATGRWFSSGMQEFKVIVTK